MLSLRHHSRPRRVRARRPAPLLVNPCTYHQLNFEATAACFRRLMRARISMKGAASSLPHVVPPWSNGGRAIYSISPCFRRGFALSPSGAAQRPATVSGTSAAACMHLSGGGSSSSTGSSSGTATQVRAVSIGWRALRGARLRHPLLLFWGTHSAGFGTAPHWLACWTGISTPGAGSAGRGGPPNGTPRSNAVRCVPLQVITLELRSRPPDACAAGLRWTWARPPP